MLSKVSTTLGLSSASMGKRERVLHIVVVEIAFGRSLRLPLAVTFLVRSCRRRLKRGGDGGGSRRRGRLRERTGNRHGGGRPHNRLAVGANHRCRQGLGVGTGIGRFEIDNVAQEDLALVELVAPNDDGLE